MGAKKYANAANYFQAFKGVSNEQLARFEHYMCKAMKASINKVCGDLWLMAEGELVARQFDVEIESMAR